MTVVQSRLPLLKEMFTLQSNTNTIVNPNWINAGNDWDAAIMAEASEGLESLGYKWWKLVMVDLPNARTELVDVWHFLMSKIIENIRKNKKEDEVKSVTEIIEEICDICSDSQLITSDYPRDEEWELDNKLAIQKHKSLVKNCLTGDNIKVTLFSFHKCLESLGMSFEDLVKFYLVKNVLNNLRAKHGYKTGEYQKEWSYGGVKMEDNSACLEVYSKMVEMEMEINYDTLFNNFEHQYLHGY